MNEDIALKAFFELHSNLPREGPGTNEATTQAFAFLTDLPDHPRILDLGCGPGMQTIQLAHLCNGHITAVDLHQPYLNQLQQQIEHQGLGDRITPLRADMGDLPFDPESFDLIWSEGAAYILEFGNALRKWRSLLKPNGYLAVTEISWTHPHPPDEVRNFWMAEYPSMQTVDANLAQAQSIGYRPLAHFVLPESAWWDHYYAPLEDRLHQLHDQYAKKSETQAVLDLHRQEIDLFRRYSRYYNYVFYILQVTA